MRNDYAITFNEHGTFTPNGRTEIDAATHNAQLDAEHLAAWAAQPSRMLVYYEEQARTVTTWTGTVLGIITRFNIYRHNFGGSFVSVRVRGTNGADYYGRASYNNGNVIRLRKATS